MLTKTRILTVVIFCFVGIILIAITSQSHWPDSLTTHTLVQRASSQLEPLWVQTVFAPKLVSRQLAATDGKVFLIGSLSQTGNLALVALDSVAGQKLWQISPATTVAVDFETVYIDQSDSVVAYTFAGKKTWRTKIHANNIASIDLVEGRLYVNAYGSHTLDAQTGELLATSSQLYAFEGNFASGLFFMNTSAFTPHYVFTRAANMETYYTALALERQKGAVLWETPNNVISNIVVTESLAFVITYEDELRILDVKTGKLLEKIQIEPSINYFDAETQPYSRVYQLAVDQTQQLLYVLLGDSNQLFAFKINH